LKNKILLQKHFHLQESAINEWPYWMFEENVKIVNEILEEEENKRNAGSEEQQAQMGNFNPDSIMKSAESIKNNFKPPKI
jgi:hypothetical protein